MDVSDLELCEGLQSAKSTGSARRKGGIKMLEADMGGTESKREVLTKHYKILR